MKIFNFFKKERDVKNSLTPELKLFLMLQCIEIAAGMEDRNLSLQERVSVKDNAETLYNFITECL